jgi:DNA-binding response OmpR family regulator
MIKPTDVERARILIVDDCPDCASLLAELLESQDYRAVHITTDATVICDLHDLNAYDLILLGMHMPYVIGLNIMA